MMNTAQPFWGLGLKCASRVIKVSLNELVEGAKILCPHCKDAQLTINIDGDSNGNDLSDAFDDLDKKISNLGS